MRRFALFFALAAGCSHASPPAVVAPAAPPPVRDAPPEPTIEVFESRSPKLKSLRIFEDGSVHVAGHRAGRLVATQDGWYELADVDWKALYRFKASPGFVIFSCDVYFHLQRGASAIELGLGGRVLEVDPDGVVSDTRGEKLGRIEGVPPERRWLALVLVLAARYAQDARFRNSINAAMAGAPC
jgi:hypothetical protein